LSGYRLSALAELDLADIADYATDTWGAKQANLYLDSLANASSASLGRRVSDALAIQFTPVFAGSNKGSTSSSTSPARAESSSAEFFTRACFQPGTNSWKAGFELASSPMMTLTLGHADLFTFPFDYEHSKNKLSSFAPISYRRK